MKSAYSLPLLSLLVACVPPGAVPDPVSAPYPMTAPRQQATQPRPVPVPAPRPVITTPAPRPVVNPPVTPSSLAIAAWADVSLSPGRWVYQPPRGGPSRALFGPANAPSLIVSCEPGRSIALTKTGVGTGPLTIRTSSTARSLPGAASPQGLRALVPANDPVLDAIAFSRGRFAVEAQGAAPLVIPAWPELARVVEDCRR